MHDTVTDPIRPLNRRPSVPNQVTEMTTPPPLIYVECDLPEGVTLAEWRRRGRRGHADTGAKPAGPAHRARARLVRLARRRGAAA